MDLLILIVLVVLVIGVVAGNRERDKRLDRLEEDVFRLISELRQARVIPEHSSQNEN